MKISEQKLQAAERYLNKVLAATPIGEKLPSLRTLIRESLSSRAAIEHFLRLYEKHGILKRIKRVGILRTPNDGKVNFDVVACHNGGYLEGMNREFLTEVVKNVILFGEKQKYTIRVHSVSINDSVEQYCKIAALTDSSGFVLLRPNMTELINLFKQTNKPVVVVFPEGVFSQIDQVITATSTVTMQMKHLIAQGHKHILYMREEYPDYHAMTLMFRRLEYFRFMAQHGLKSYPHWCSSYPSNGIEEALQQTFSRQPTPTALIVYDMDVEAVYQFLTKRNLVIGKDISVLATDGMAMLRDFSPPVTTVVSHVSQTVQAIFALLEKQRSGDKTPKRLEVMLTFRQGLSDGPPPATEYVNT